eukprot:NODE_185_length_13590_cov_0.472908.p4 type:complete len:346 gc:universal NODE_185_length_13590_cov_0.472908:4323-5360(+)
MQRISKDELWGSIDGLASLLPDDVKEFCNNYKRNIPEKKKKFLFHFPIKKNVMTCIIQEALLVIKGEPALLRIEGSCILISDIHGQFNDLFVIFNKHGFPPTQKYLFLGDYVDRGYQSLETILLLLCFKALYPKHIYLLRGNHEAASVNRIYGFYDECKRKCSVSIWKSFVDFFNHLPISAILNDKIFCVHGGISPELQTLDQITNIFRPCDIPDKGLLCDLLWSDPTEKLEDFGENERGVSVTFGGKSIEAFLNTNNLDLIIRGHLVIEDGYLFHSKKRCVTLFSAPNYCGEFDNVGSTMTVNRDLKCSFTIFEPWRRARYIKHAELPKDETEPFIQYPANYIK